MPIVRRARSRRGVSYLKHAAGADVRRPGASNTVDLIGLSRSVAAGEEQRGLQNAFSRAFRACVARLALSPYITGSVAQCPRCGTVALKRLTAPDRVDRFAGTVWSALERLRGGSLYHCTFCRIQFYDTRARQKLIKEPARIAAGMQQPQQEYEPSGSATAQYSSSSSALSSQLKA